MTERQQQILKVIYDHELSHTEEGVPSTNPQTHHTVKELAEEGYVSLRFTTPLGSVFDRIYIRMTDKGDTFIHLMYI